MLRMFVFLAGLGALVTALAITNLTHIVGMISQDWMAFREPARQVVVAPPIRGEIIQTIVAPGEVELVEEANITSQIIGKVSSVHVEDGSVVKAGDLLVKLDETDAKARLDASLAQVDRIRSSITKAEADRSKALRDLVRTRHLVGKNAVGLNELDDARSLLDIAEATLAMCRNEQTESEAMLRSARENLHRTEVRSPINGIVSSLDVVVGEVVIAGTTNLPGTVMMTIGDPSHLMVRADVDETDVPMVKADLPARIYLLANPKEPILGTVALVASMGEKADDVVSFETMVRIDSPGAILRPGMTASVEIEVHRVADALTLPVQAIGHRRRRELPDTPAVRSSWVEQHLLEPGESARGDESQYLLIAFVCEDGIARARPVEIGLSDERRVEILSGIDPTDRVVVGPFHTLDQLDDGSPVEYVDGDDMTHRIQP